MTNHVNLPVELYAIVSGRVQKVAFRFKVKKIADNYGLTGYAQNLPNGSVVVVCQGLQDRVEAFLKEMESLGDPVQIEDIKTVMRSPQKSFTEFGVH
jgi:acylphosphatase